MKTFSIYLIRFDRGLLCSKKLTLSGDKSLEVWQRAQDENPEWAISMFWENW